MHPSIHAKTQPERPAIIMAGSGETVTFAELDRRSNQVAQLLPSRGIQGGDTVAPGLENHPGFFVPTSGVPALRRALRRHFQPPDPARDRLYP